MNEYPHIDGVYKRDERGKFIMGEYSQEAFEYLEDKYWVWTEKIDGTNIRIMWDGKEVHIGGKTDNAQIPARFLNDWVGPNIYRKKFLDVFGEEPVCLYGEGYGAGIQKGGLYSPDQKFILFDVKIGNWWLKRDAIDDIATKLGLDVVPIVAGMPLLEAIRWVSKDWVKFGSTSKIGTAPAEGIVGQPVVPLFNRAGGRVMVKIKVRDFK